jgi:chromate reductase
MTSQPFRAIAFSGSLRTGSSNTALVRLFQRIAPPELQVEWIDWIDELPWMNPDLEEHPPEILQRWWKALRDADALIVGMPEYNWSPTPLAKNALDWATRPPDDRAIKDTVVAFLGSGGRGGTAKAQENLTLILGYMGATMVIEPPVQLSFVADKIDTDGNTDDPDILAAVQAKLDAVMIALHDRAARHEAEALDS